MTSSIQSTRAAKRALRKSMAEKLSSLTTSEISRQSSIVTQKILNSPTYAQASSVSIYVSMQSGEIDTDQLCRRTLDQGKRLYVPLFASNSSTKTPSSTVGLDPVPSNNGPSGTSFSTDMRMMRLLNLKEYESMPANKWGIREPGEVYDEGGHRREDALDSTTGGEGLDLILLPGVAFDSRGGRLGHGKGYYDRYISRCEVFASEKRKPGPVTVALGLLEQVLPANESVPVDENDKVLDAIVTAEATISKRDSRWNEASAEKKDLDSR